MAKNIDDLKQNASPVRVSVVRPVDVKNIKKDAGGMETERDRIVIDLSDMKPKKEESPNITYKKSLQDDILNLDNPDSPMSKYIERKEKEMDKMIKKIDEHEKLAKNDFIDEDGTVYEDEDGETANIGVETLMNEEDFGTEESGITVEDSTNFDDINLDLDDLESPKDEVDIEEENNEEEEEEDMAEDFQEEVEEQVEETKEEVNFPAQAPNVDDIEDLTKEKEEVVEEDEHKDDVDMDSELEELDKEEEVEPDPTPKKKEAKKDTSVIMSEDEIDIEMDTAITEFKELNDEGEEIDEGSEEEDEIEESEEDVLKQLQKLATEKMKPVSKVLDIRSFTRAKKPTANLKALKSTNSTNVKVASWVLPEQNAIVRMKEFLGSELETLRMNSDSNDNFYKLNTRYKMIYDHIVSAKPDSFEVWCKTTPYADVDHYFFCAFIASFYGTNFIPITCENKECKNKMHLTDNIPVLAMVKFDNEESKEKFTELYKSTREKAGKLYTTEVVPLSDKVAIGFKEATIYSLFEIASLDSKFKSKFANILDYFPYIDCVYLIDQEKQELTPIGHKIYPDNPRKTTMSKIVMLNRALETLTIDQFGPIKAYVNALISKRSKIGFHYIVPETNCPSCGSTIDETPITAEELVFTRYQLGALTSTSIS